MEAQWYADRTRLRTLLQKEPTWSLQELAATIGRSLMWIKKWKRRLLAAPATDEAVLHSHSHARIHPPARLDPLVVSRILDIRDHPPPSLHRIPGPRAIRYFLERDATLQAAYLRTPRSSRTIWQILRAHGRIVPPAERQHQLIERPGPMVVWELDFKDVTTVAPTQDGKQAHVVEVLNTVDVGTSILVNAQAREDFSAEEAMRSVVETFQASGMPFAVTIDRDPRFVGGAHPCDFPSPFVRLLTCLGIQVTICPPRRPDRKPFVERFNRTLEEEALQVERPSDLGAVREVLRRFQHEYNYERPNQAQSCQNRPPRLAFPLLPLPRQLPAMVDPDRWLQLLDGQRYVRKVRANGTVTIDSVSYYIDQAQAGKYVTLLLDAARKLFVVEEREQPIKELPIKGLMGERLPLAVYLERMQQEARAQMLLGRPQAQQLRLPLETLDTAA